MEGQSSVVGQQVQTPSSSMQASTTRHDTALQRHTAPSAHPPPTTHHPFSAVEYITAVFWPQGTGTSERQSDVPFTRLFDALPFPPTIQRNKCALSFVTHALILETSIATVDEANSLPHALSRVIQTTLRRARISLWSSDPPSQLHRLPNPPSPSGAHVAEATQRRRHDHNRYNAQGPAP